MFGSTANGLALKGTSDIDVCVTLPPTDTPNFNILYEVVIRNLRDKDSPYESTLVHFLNDLAFRGTFGEILEMKVVSRENLSLRRHVGVTIERAVTNQVTDLISTYAKLDQRFVILATILKRWNKKTFSGNKPMLISHAVVLMTIAYLQHEGVLPRLQTMNHETKQSFSYIKYFLEGGTSKQEGRPDIKSAEKVDIDIGFERDIGKIKEMHHISEEAKSKTVAQLLIGFFQFYSNQFLCEKHVISISHYESLIDREEYHKML